jgi:hypoxanthine phosphoribosyltransferase
MRELISTDDLHEGICQMASQITSCYGEQPLTVIGVLTGCVVALADLIRQLHMPLRICFVEASSYRGATERGPLQLQAESLLDVVGRDVLLVDDIFDTGHTLVEVMQLVETLKPNSVRSAVLLRKLGRQEVELQPDFVGFDIPDEFVVGYGLDYQDLYRNLPFVAALDPDDLQADPRQESRSEI